jgi:hypothetical protein
MKTPYRQRLTAIRRMVAVGTVVVFLAALLTVAAFGKGSASTSGQDSSAAGTAQGNAASSAVSAEGYDTFSTEGGDDTAAAPAVSTGQS